MLKKKLKKLKNKIFFYEKSNKKYQRLILNNLNILMEQGYSLNEALEMLENKHNLSILINYLLEGNSLADSLEFLNFDSDILLIIKISENSGTIKKGIKRSILILDNKMANKSKVMEKLKYPIALFILLFLSISFISTFLLPMFMNVYENFGIEIEGWVKVLFDFLSILPRLILLFSLFFIIFSFYYSLQSQSDRLKLLLKNKFVSKKYYRLYNHLFLINLHFLLNIGLKLDEVFKILKEQKYNYLLKKESKVIFKELEKGQDLVIILKKRKIYNEEIINSIEDGIEKGTLVFNLRTTLLMWEEQNSKKFEKYIYLMQPLFYLFFGVLIIILYACIFIPMFKMMDQL